MFEAEPTQGSRFGERDDFLALQSPSRLDICTAAANITAGSLRENDSLGYPWSALRERVEADHNRVSDVHVGAAAGPNGHLEPAPPDRLQHV